MCPTCAEKQRIATAEKRAALLKLGFCTACGKNRIYLNEAKCFECSEKAKLSAKKSKSSIPDEIRKARINDYARKRRAKMKALGKCTRCGKTAISGHTLCYKCLNSDTFKYRLKLEGVMTRAERISNGKCYFCGGDVMQGYKVCEKHYQCSVNNLPKTRDNHYWRIDNQFIKKAK